jgi:futalosine hydrolase
VTASSRDLLVVASTEREAACFRDAGVPVVVSGVGRVNAAIATTMAIMSHSEDAASLIIVSAGIAGALPDVDGSPSVDIGTVVLGSAAHAAEEGILTNDGFRPIGDLGFPIAGFAPDNRIEADGAALARLTRAVPDGTVGDIATVATCSGTDELAREIARRTSAIAEAMEGAGVLHAARLLGAAAAELRVISNTTGDRERQVWRIDDAFEHLGRVARLLAGS